MCSEWICLLRNDSTLPYVVYVSILTYVVSVSIDYSANSLAASFHVDSCMTIQEV